MNLLLIDSTKAELFVAVTKCFPRKVHASAEGFQVRCQSDEILMPFSHKHFATVAKTNPEQRQQDRTINKLIMECLDEAGVAISELSAVAVVAGPGSWTGIRVGLAVAKAYSYALGIPIIELTDKIDVAMAVEKYAQKAFVTPFTVKPFYNGEFVVNKKN